MFRSVQRQSALQLRNFAKAPLAGRSYSAVTKEPFNWKDPLGSNNLFTEDELAIAETAEAYCQERMLPRVLGTMTSLKFCHFDSLLNVMQMLTEMRNSIAKSWKRWESWDCWVLQFKATTAPA